MTYIANSIQARDIASLVHMQTNLRRHQSVGPVVITRGEGCRVWDDSGREHIEAVAGLWCASLGFGSERLARVAYEQMRSLGYYHLYRHSSNEPAVALAEKLLAIAPVPMARVISHELTLLGVHGMAVRHYGSLLSEIAAGRLDPGRLVGATVPLDAAGAELAAMGAFTRHGTTVITSF